MVLVPVMVAATPSVTLVAMVKFELKFAAGVKVTPASSALTSAMRAGGGPHAGGERGR